MANEGLILSLAVQESGRGPRKETFEKESVTIGAGSSADLQVKGENVSDVHAMFDMSRQGEVHVMDLGSIAGTFVNGKKVNKQKLDINDEVKVGDVTVKIVGFGKEVVEAAPPELDVKEKEAEAAKPAPEAEAKVEAKPEKKEEPAKAAREEKKEEAVKPEKEVEEAALPEETLVKLSAEEEKAIAAKQAMLDEMKRRKASRTSGYTLELIPKEHKDPGKNRVLEVREVLWDNTLLSVRHLYHENSLTLGESKSCDYFMSHEDLPSAPFKFVKRDGDKAYVHISDKMEGTFEPNGKSMSLSEAIGKQKLDSVGNGVFALPIEPGACATIKFEEVKYYIRWVEKEKLEKLPLSKNIDYPITSLLVAVFVFYVVGYIWIRSMPAPEVADILDAPERFAKLILEDVQLEEEPEEKPEVIETEKAMGEQGKVGKQEAELDKTEGSNKKTLDEQAANDAGILNALDQGSESMDSIFGGALDLEKNLGTLDGISGLDMRGSGGLGSRGSGYGGGGSALGIGGLGTKGRGGGRGGSTYGIGEGGNLKKGNANINIKTGNPSIQGALDKSIIARIIGKHHSQIRYCYQKELNKNPKLYGKITVKFTISPAGTVSSSVVQVSTMKNANVEQCVARTIKRIIFPRPKGGGIVVVTYPFIFKAEGT